MCRRVYRPGASGDAVVSASVPAGELIASPPLYPPVPPCYELVGLNASLIRKDISVVYFPGDANVLGHLFSEFPLVMRALNIFCH